MSSECGQARRHVWPDAGPRSASPEVIAARLHVDACADCQRFIGEMRLMSTLVRDAAPRERAPADVRHRLFATLARERTGTVAARPGTRSLGWRVVVAVVLVLSGAGIVARQLGGGSSDGLARIAEDHARAFGDVRLESDDPVALSRWLESQVYFAVHVPVLPEARLRGARVAALDGGRAAVIEYDVGDVNLSYFIVRDHESSRHEDAMRFDRMMRDGYGVVMWRDPGRLHVMIGRLPESRLEVLAKICVEQARGVGAVLGGKSLSQET